MLGSLWVLDVHPRIFIHDQVSLGLVVACQLHHLEDITSQISECLGDNLDGLQAYSADTERFSAGRYVKTSSMFISLC